MTRLYRIIAETEAALSRQSDTARGMVMNASALDGYWKDEVHSLVAVLNAKAAASLALDLLALQEAASLLDGKS